MIQQYELYKGHSKSPMPDFEPIRYQGNTSYVVSEGLKNAVNVALMLGQPLLLTGEPGTGKTQLAHHLANHFKLDPEEINFYVFNTQSTSTAKDLFYSYDSLGHFQYVQNNQVVLSTQEVEEKFIKYQALGAAIRSGKRCVVLIDEIDKAPRDFPNDILAAIEQLEFEVPEINRTGQDVIRTEMRFRPIVVMTSNSEKALPDAFLRRCIFYHIPFPNRTLLLQILQVKHAHFSDQEYSILVQHFEEIRSLIKKKKPSTAELINWVSILEKIGFNVQKLHNPSSMDTVSKKLLAGSYTALAKNKEDSKLIIDHIL